MAIINLIIFIIVELGVTYLIEKVKSQNFNAVYSYVFQVFILNNKLVIPKTLYSLFLPKIITVKII